MDNIISEEEYDGVKKKLFPNIKRVYVTKFGEESTGKVIGIEYTIDVLAVGDRAAEMKAKSFVRAMYPYPDNDILVDYIDLLEEESAGLSRAGPLKLYQVSVDYQTGEEW